MTVGTPEALIDHYPYSVGMTQTVVKAAANEDWDLLVSFFPSQLVDRAASTGAARAEQDKAPKPCGPCFDPDVPGSASELGRFVRRGPAQAAEERMALPHLRWQLFGNMGSVSSRLPSAVRCDEVGHLPKWRLHTASSDFFKLTATEGRGRVVRSSSCRPGDYVLVDRG